VTRVPLEGISPDFEGLGSEGISQLREPFDCLSIKLQLTAPTKVNCAPRKMALISNEDIL